VSFVAALCAAGLLAGCGSTGISAAAIDISLRGTFANLYVLQQVEEGYARPSRAALAVTATCTKGGATSVQAGPGDDWTCAVDYHVSGLASDVTATYDVNVQSDGCYAAESDGPATVDTPLGRQEIGDEARTITAVGAGRVVNPLWLIDGCFDVS
jgi:ABC-2 type transport system permease protein